MLLNEELSVKTSDLAIYKDEHTKLTIEAQALKRSLEAKLIEKGELST